MNNLIVLGSTGSIGTQTLDVCRKHNINVIALSANRSIGTIEKQIIEFKPEYVCLTDETAGNNFKTRAEELGVKLLIGKQGLVKLAQLDADDTVVLNAVVGIAGLEATLAAIETNKKKALANKEGLIDGDKDMALDEKDLNFLSEKYGLTMKMGYLGESKSLDSLGITQINLAKTDETNLEDNFDGKFNQLMTQEGATFVQNGKEKDYVDVWNAKK